MKIAIGSDHAGVEYKSAIIKHLEEKGHTVKDFGPATSASVDYPDYIHPVASAVESGDAECGIILCGTGNGAAMTANKHAGIRAALCWRTDIARLARQHNDANILDLPARFVSLQDALGMVDVFLSEPFEGGRHQTRIEKIPCR